MNNPYEMTVMYEALPRMWNPTHNGPTLTTTRNDPCPCGSGKKVKHCCRDGKYKRVTEQVKK